MTYNKETTEGGHRHSKLRLQLWLHREAGHRRRDDEGLRPGPAGHHGRARRADPRGRRLREEKRQVHYLSLEFLMGRSLMKNAYQPGRCWTP